MKQKGFSLPEILIIIAILGVVAAMVVPTLIRTIDSKVKGYRMQVFEKKFIKGTDLLHIDNGIGPYYNSTEDFVKELSKHLKITKICGKDELDKCMPYNKIIKRNGTTKNLSSYINGKDFGINVNSTNAYDDVAALVLADGTPMILSWNKNCPVPNTYETGTTNTTSCITGYYDYNGSSKPNKIGEDIVGFNSGCVVDMGSFCLSKPFKPVPFVTYEECNQVKGDLGIEGCSRGAYLPDYWGGGIRTCGGIDKMPTGEDLGILAQELYDNQNNYKAKSEIATMIGLTPQFNIMISGGTSGDGGYFVSFYNRGFRAGGDYRMGNNMRASYAMCKVEEN